LLFVWYRWSYAPKDAAIAGLQSLTDALRASAAQAAKPAAAAAAPAAPATMAALLSQTQEIASRYDVDLTQATPNPLNPDLLTLSLKGDYRGVMRFLGRLETLNATLSGFDLAPAPDGGLVASAEVLRLPKPGAPAAFADYMDAMIAYTATRDPFAQGDPVPPAHVGADLGDLSWTYHLTSITLIGAVRIATIDGKDYGVGDRLGTMTIRDIGPSSVSLTAPGTVLVQKLHFRHNPAGADER
jgi:hypothetical protein